MFNNPMGSQESQDRTMVHVRQAINHAPKHSLIRIATYSLDRPDVTKALIDACKRKVAVQLVLNDNWTSGQTRSMRRMFGTTIDPHFEDGCNPRDPAKFAEPWPYPSYVKILPGRAGSTARWATSTSSSSSSPRPAGRTTSSWSAPPTSPIRGTDPLERLVHDGEPTDSYAAYSAIHRELAKDVPVLEPHVLVVDGDLTSEFGAIIPRVEENDPLWLRLNQVSCQAPPGYGQGGHTVIRVMMYAWVGNRGQYLARKSADLDRQGCDVRVILSGAGSLVKKILRRGGVQIAARTSTPTTTSRPASTTPRGSTSRTRSGCRSTVCTPRLHAGGVDRLGELVASPRSTTR